MALATGISDFLLPLTTAPSLTLVYVTAVAWIALRYGLWPAVFTSMLSIAAWDYFLTRPYYSLYIGDPRDVLALIVFLTAALTLSSVSAHVRQQSEKLAGREKMLSRLYRFGLSLGGITTLESLGGFVIEQMSAIFESQALLLLAGPGGKLLSLYPEHLRLDESDLRQARRILDCESDEDSVAITAVALLPLDGPNGRIGAVGLARGRFQVLSPDEKLLLDSLRGQIAIAAARIQLADELEHARLTAESERLRNALLTSVSHDLRTPLTSIIIALSALDSGFRLRTLTTKRELVTTALREAMRLDRFIGNLLSMTRIEAGMLNVKRVPVDVAEVADAAVERASPLLERHKLAIEIAPDLPLALADFSLLEQVFFNLIDNAAKYSPEGSLITVAGHAAASQILVEVADHGAGIPPESLEAIFGRFTRIEQVDRKSPGTGLGLAICRGFLHALGGSIEAANRADRSGSVFTVRLPVAPELSAHNPVPTASRRAN